MPGHNIVSAHMWITDGPEVGRIWATLCWHEIASQWLNKWKDTSRFFILLAWSFSSHLFFAERVKVAFSASLSASTGAKYIGPYAEATTLLYENAFTNIGNSYDINTGIMTLRKDILNTILPCHLFFYEPNFLPLSTGIFTAPVRGVYFFTFVVFNPYAMSTAVTLLKNGNLVVTASDNPPGQDTEDTSCNSVTLLLEQGDQIKLQLLENRRIYSDIFKRNTFSGHLLFTM